MLRYHRKRFLYILLSLFVCLGLSLNLNTSQIPIAKADTQTFAPYAMLNGDFEQPLSGTQIPGWGTYTQVGSVSLDTRAHTGTSSLNLTNGFISAWNNTMNVNPNQDNAPHAGDLVQASAWINVPDSTTDLSQPFSLWVDEVDASGHQHLIASVQLPADTPRGQWVQITTTPVDGGIIQSTTQNLVVSFQDYVPGTILVDDVQVGYLARNQQPPSQIPKPVVYNGINSSFESNLNGWGTYASTGAVSVASDGYYGKHSAQLNNPTDSDSSAIWETYPLGGNSGQPQVGDIPEAGAWVKLMPDVSPSANASLRLEVDGVAQGGKQSLLAQSDNLVNLPTGVWTYVVTQPVSGQSITSGMTGGIVISVQDNVKGTVLVDYMQAGQANSLSGDPQKFVIGEYQPWYGGPGRWHNWAWSDNRVVHNPDNVLPNGQRDIAGFYYPLVGAYDSTDPRVLQYQVDLMKSMGIDCILVDWYANLEPDYVKTFNELVDIADKSDMKVAIFYEPKIHLANWIPSSTRQGQIDGIVQDITDYLKQYSDHKSILKVRGRPVVGVFGATTTGLTSTDWAGILNTVHNEGYDPYMIGDVAAVDPPSTFDGMMNWVLYQDSLANDDSYSNVKSFSEQINSTTVSWAAADPAHRLAIGIVWPGFNDSAVDGWGGGPRVIPYSSDFYNATWDGMLAENFNWLVVATFNDFNESTTIEPSRQLGYSRAITTAQYIAKFKGTQPADATTLQGIFQQDAQEYDNTPPTIQVSQPVANSTVLDDQTLTVGYSVSDDQSGVKTSLTSSTLDGNTVSSGTSIPLYTLPLGQHRLTVQATDYVGNTSNQSVSFETTTSVQSLETLVQQFASNGIIDNQGIAVSLEQMLHNNDVLSFVHEVTAQAGVHIQKVDANYLIRDGNSLLQQ